MHRTSGTFPHPSVPSVLCVIHEPFCRSSRNISLLCGHPGELPQLPQVWQSSGGFLPLPVGLCLGAVLSAQAFSCDFLAAHLHPPPHLSLQAHCCAPFIFYSLLQCVFSDGTGIIPKCFALLSAGAQPGTSAEVAVHLQELSLKGLRMKQAKPGNTECCGAETSVPRLEGTESVMLNSASAIGFMHLFFAYQDQLAGGA